jgi:hypothetical protein
VATPATRRFVDVAAAPGHLYAYHVRAWSPGEPPLEDGNSETVTVRAGGAGERRLLVARQGGDLRLSWQPAEPVLLLASAERGSSGLALAEGSGGEATVTTPSDPMLYLRATPSDCSGASVR